MTFNVTFDYHMHGSAIGTLQLQVNDGTGWSTVWSVSGQQQAVQTDPWLTADVDIADYGLFNVRIRYQHGGSWAGDAAIDNVIITSESNSDTEGFESGLGDWSDGGGSRSWTRDSGGTTSSGTGPTVASVGTYYMYCEASSPASGGDDYILENDLTFLHADPNPPPIPAPPDALYDGPPREFDWRVTVDGVEQEAVLSGGTLTSGRSSTDEQPRAGYCRLDLIRFGGEQLPQLPLGGDVCVDLKAWEKSDYVSMVLDTGPLLYWPLGHTSGATAEDLSGNGYDGSYAGAGSAVLGVDGAVEDTRAIDLTDHDVRVTVQSASFTTVDTTVGLSLEGWIKPKGDYDPAYFSPDQTYVSLSQNTYQSPVFALEARDDEKFCLYVWDDDLNDHEIVTTDTYARDQWYYVAATYDAVTGDAILYVDGEEAATGNFGTPTITLEALAVGATWVASTIDQSTASFQHVAVTERPLTPTEVLGRYENGYREFRPVWKGSLTDREDTIERIAGDTVIRRSLYAVGPLGIAARGSSDGYLQQTETARVRQVITEVFTQSWETVAGTWAAQSGRWLNFNPEVSISALGAAGSFEVLQDTDQDDPFAALMKVQKDTGSVLFETRDGNFLYQTATDRSVAYREWDIDRIATDIRFHAEGRGLKADRRLSDVVNVAEVTYNGGVATAEDTKALRDYGRRYTRRIETSLVDADAAQQRADSILAFGINPRPTRIETFPLAVLDHTAIGTLAALSCGDFVLLDELPIDVDTLGFVEKIEWNLSHRDPRVTLTVSPITASIIDTSMWLLQTGTWADQVGSWSGAPPTPSPIQQVTLYHADWTVGGVGGGGSLSINTGSPNDELWLDHDLVDDAAYTSRRVELNSPYTAFEGDPVTMAVRFRVRNAPSNPDAMWWAAVGVEQPNSSAPDDLWYDVTERVTVTDSVFTLSWSVDSYDADVHDRLYFTWGTHAPPDSLDLIVESYLIIPD